MLTWGAMCLRSRILCLHFGQYSTVRCANALYELISASLYTLYCVMCIVLVVIL